MNSEIHNIELTDMDAWDDFVRDNRDAIIDRYGSIDTALKHARDGGLELGGGAAPLFIITFEF